MLSVLLPATNVLCCAALCCSVFKVNSYAAANRLQSFLYCQYALTTGSCATSVSYAASQDLSFSFLHNCIAAGTQFCHAVHLHRWYTEVHVNVVTHKDTRPLLLHAAVESKLYLLLLSL